MSRSDSEVRLLLVTNRTSVYRYPLFHSLQEGHYRWQIAASRISVDAPGSYIQIGRRTYGTLVWYSGVAALVWSRRFRAVVLPGDPHVLSTALAIAIGRFRGVRVVLWSHGFSPGRSWMSNLVKLVLFRSADALMVYSSGHFESRLSNLLKKSAVHVVGNSLPMPELDLEEEEVRRVRDGDDVSIVCVSRLMRRRRLDSLVRAARILQDRGEGGIRLRVVGDDDEDVGDELLGLASSLGVRLELLGAIHDPDRLLEFYSRAALTAIPAAAGLAVIQSLAYGVPVVITDGPSNGPEVEAVVSGLNGVRCAEADDNALADSIGEALALRASGGLSADTCVGSVAGYEPGLHAARITRAVLETLAR